MPCTDVTCRVEEPVMSDIIMTKRGALAALFFWLITMFFTSSYHVFYRHQKV
jgi:hypothetical protein